MLTAMKITVTGRWSQRITAEHEKGESDQSLEKISSVHRSGCVSLTLKGEGWTTVDERITSLPHLKELILDGTTVETLPFTLPENLRILRIFSSAIPVLPSQIEELELFKLACTEPLDNYFVRSCLKKLTITHCGLELLPFTLPESLVEIHIGKSNLRALPGSLKEAKITYSNKTLAFTFKLGNRKLVIIDLLKNPLLIALNTAKLH